MARTPFKVRQYPKATSLTAGPFLGVRDSTDPTTADPQYLRRASNVYKGPGPANGAIVGRPGTEAMGASLGTIVQAGPVTWTTFAGVSLTLAVADGVVKAYDWNAGTWSVVLSQGAITGAGGALSTSARVALIPFADQLIITDCLHRMLWWDGTTGSGLTVLTHAPIPNGPPCVYYAKLFVPTDRTLYWSEEGDATIGYDANVGGRQYVSAWDGVGGLPEPMTAVAATNEALYVFRARSSLCVTGAVSSDFATAGTTANLSPRIGTRSPWAVLRLTQGIFAPDADGKPHLFHYGNPEPLALWADCYETVRQTPQNALVNAVAVADEATRTVILGLPGVIDTYPTQWLAFTDQDLQFQGVWTFGTPASCAGVVIDANGAKRWAHAERSGGKCVAHGTPELGPWIDRILGMTAGIPHELVGPFLGWDPFRDVLVDAVEASFTEGSAEMSIAYETTEGIADYQTVSVGTSSSGFTWGVSVWDGAAWGNDRAGGHAMVGCSGRGRFVSPRIRHGVPNEPFGVDALRVTASFTQGHASSR